MIDFAGQEKSLEKDLLCYFDLSPSGDTKEASKNLFSVLRKSEQIKNAKYILLPNLCSEENEDKMAIFDRVFRAASGKFIKII